MQFEKEITLPEIGEYAEDMRLEDYHPALQAVLKVAPFYAELLGSGLMLLVSSLNQYLYYKPCEEIPLKLKAGNRPKPNGGVNKATQAGHRIVELRERQEASFWLISDPIRAPDKSIVGNMILGMPLEKQQKLIRLSENLIEKSKSALPRVEKLSDATEGFSATNEELKEKFSEIAHDIETINSHLTTIKEISRRSNMLGINASIEATRAGDRGSGFNVVAEHVRNLSNRTSNLVNDVTVALNELDERVTQFNKNIESMSTVAHEEKDALQQLQESFNELISTSDQLREQANEIGLK
ncbi:MAG: methyl-accepting chemotaxis protein [Nanobdellota archaeon]